MGRAAALAFALKVRTASPLAALPAINLPHQESAIEIAALDVAMLEPSRLSRSGRAGSTFVSTAPAGSLTGRSWTPPMTTGCEGD
jgi:hypothetical protein